MILSSDPLDVHGPLVKNLCLRANFYRIGSRTGLRQFMQKIALLYESRHLSNDFSDETDGVQQAMFRWQVQLKPLNVTIRLM